MDAEEELLGEEKGFGVAVGGVPGVPDVDNGGVGDNAEGDRELLAEGEVAEVTDVGACAVAFVVAAVRKFAQLELTTGFTGNGFQRWEWDEGHYSIFATKFPMSKRTLLPGLMVREDARGP